MFVSAVGNQTDFGMILHFLSDDKFSDYVVEQFSEPEMHSEFVLMSASETMVYFQHTECVTLINPYQSESMKKIIDSLHSYSAVVLHGLFYPWCETVLRNVPTDTKVAWVFWGGEIYGRKDLRERFLSKRSKWLLRIRELKRGLEKQKRADSYEFPLELFNRIDFCLTDVHEDFEFVKAYTQSNMAEVWYNYYSIEETIGDLKNQSVEGNNILVGNSCTMMCNHLDGFKVAKKLYNNAEIIVPLSYGEPWLRNLLMKKGKRMFGKKFRPLVEFIPRDEYNKIIKSCSVVIMPHYRPQAFGNILTALWLGSRVYMSEKSLLYAFFKRIGMNVFSIEIDLEKTRQANFSPLSVEEREWNRKVIASIYDKGVMKGRIREIVELLEKR